MAEAETAAKLLQGYICNVVCAEDPLLKHQSRQWLLLDRKPTHIELFQPEPYSFIDVCRTLGLSWLKLKRSLAVATRIQDPIRHLQLVHNSELRYNLKDETDSNSYGTSQIKRSEH